MSYWINKSTLGLAAVALLGFVALGCTEASKSKTKTTKESGNHEGHDHDGHDHDGHDHDGDGHDHDGDGHDDHEGHDHEGDGHQDHDADDHDGDQAHHQDGDAAEVAAALAKLSPEDRVAAEKQRICPVTGELLGSMGTPLKILVSGQDVFICCLGCEDELKKNADKYLAKVAG